MKVKLLTVAVMLAGICAGPSLAQEKTALTPGSIEQIDLAARLTNYGIARNDPLLLLAAARIIDTVSADAAPVAAPLDSAALKAKAAELAKGKPELEKLAEVMKAEASRGLCHGPGTVYGCF